MSQNYVDLTRSSALLFYPSSKALLSAQVMMWWKHTKLLRKLVRAGCRKVLICSMSSVDEFPFIKTISHSDMTIYHAMKGHRLFSLNSNVCIFAENNFACQVGWTTRQQGINTNPTTPANQDSVFYHIS